MFIKLKSLLLSLIVFAGTPLISEAANLADYNPLGLGSYWTYQNAADSNDTYTVSVFEKFVFSGFNGQPAVKFGTDSNNYSIGYNNGTSVNIYEGTENGIPSVSIGNFTDGTFFNLIEPTNFVLLRMYDNLNPTLKSVYDINEPNLVLWATYDSRYPKNSQNSIVESNLGITIPNYAVTHLEWYAKDVGEIVKLDVDASTGTIGARYELIAHNIVPLDPFIGTQTITLYGDDNISDGVVIDSIEAATNTSRYNNGDYAIEVITGPTFSMVRRGDNELALSPQPQDMGTWIAANVYMLSDGFNGAFLMMGKDPNPLDIGIRVATWAPEVEVSGSQLAGQWLMKWIFDDNLRDSYLSVFSVEYEMLTITDLGSGQVSVQFGDITWLMNINGNKLDPAEPLDPSLVYFSMVTDGKGIAVTFIGVETYDPTDVSARIGLASRGQFGSFDGKKNVKLSLRDCNDNDVTFILTGAGYGEIDFYDCNFSSIVLYNTNEKSGFTIKTKGKIETSVGDIIVNGSLKRIMATTTDLRGDISVTGGLGMLVLDDITDGHTITIGQSANPKAGVVMKFDQIKDLTISSEMPIKMLTATEWLGGSINAPSVGSITTKGDKKRGISGDLLEVDLNLSQKPDAKIPALGKLTVKGWIDSSRILSTGNIGTVSAWAITNSSCFAGVTDTNDLNADGVLDLPDPAVDVNYVEPATIKSITIKGIKGEPYCVINSNIAAAQILGASLAYPENENDGIPFGLSAGFIKTLKIKDAEGTESWKNLDKPSDSKEFGDAKVLLY